VTDPGEELLLMDPSVFLGNAGFAWLEEVPHDQRDRFVVSRTFFDQVAGSAEYTAADEQLWGPLPPGETRRVLQELLAGLTMFSVSDVQRQLPFEAIEVANRLSSMGSQVALEEWLYLYSNSWLAARSRHVLNHFKRAGAKVVEVGSNAFDDATLLALGQRPGTPATLTPALRARAGVNVLLVGGLAAAGVAIPWLVVPGAIAVFLLTPSWRSHRPRRRPKRINKHANADQHYLLVKSRTQLSRVLPSARIRLVRNVHAGPAAG
jgi:hypothetical protein